MKKERCQKTIWRIHNRKDQKTALFLMMLACWFGGMSLSFLFRMRLEFVRLPSFIVCYTAYIVTGVAAIIVLEIAWRRQRARWKKMIYNQKQKSRQDVLLEEVKK